MNIAPTLLGWPRNAQAIDPRTIWTQLARSGAVLRMPTARRVVSSLIVLAIVLPAAAIAATNGTVFYVGTQGGLTGGPITSAGNISIATGGVTRPMIADGAVNNSKIAGGSITNSKLGGSAVSNSKIADGAVNTSKLADGAVNQSKLAGGSVTNSKLAGGAVSNSKILDGAVNTSKLADGSVTLAKLSFDPATQAELDAAVTSLAANDTTYSAGDGLILNATTFIVDFVSVQHRLTGSCPSGSAIRDIDQDGAVTCETDNDTTYGAGNGIILNGTSFEADLSVLQARVTGTCDPGAWISGIAADGSLTCEDDNDTVYGAANGIVLNGTTFEADPTILQLRLTGSCDPGSAIRDISEQGDVTCEPDNDTTYGAGNGILLNGTSFEADLGVVQARVTGTCDAGAWISEVAEDGSVTCVDDNDTVYGAANGILLNGTSFEADLTLLQHRLIAPCAPGTAIRDIDQTGAVTCEADNDTTYSAGTGLDLNGTVFLANFSLVQHRLASPCATGSAIRDIGASGTPTCELIPAYTNGFGLNLTGTTFSVNGTDVQKRVSASCAAGSSIRVVNTDGTVVCQADTNSGGTVTSIVNGSGLAGGPITTSGTLSIATGGVTVAMTSFIKAIATLSIDVPITSASAVGCGTATLTGAATTDRLMVTPPSTFTAGWAYVGARISAANTLEVCWLNLTGGNSNPQAVNVWAIDLN